MLGKLIFFALSASQLLVSAKSPPRTFNPCPNNDIECIRDYFAKLSVICNPNTFKALPAKVAVPVERFETPFFNASHVDLFNHAENMDKCEVSVFYITDQSTVLTFDCKDFIIDTIRAHILHTPGYPSKRYTVHQKAYYELVRLTAVIPSNNRLDICKVKATAWITTPVLKPQGVDQESQEFVLRDERGFFKRHLREYAREAWEERGNSLFRYIVDNLICDYNCNPCA